MSFLPEKSRYFRSWGGGGGLQPPSPSPARTPMTGGKRVRIRLGLTAVTAVDDLI